ncbi:MAG: hypothetical protein PHO01_09275 [Desulfotomaculaceae bacterium]|nr:hypothetical protein [Desulfotomaculaceae bacterium]
MTRKTMKWLRTLHIISAGIWFGATVCIDVLGAICFFNLSVTDFLRTVPLIPELYKIIILPIAIFTILQGLIYGFFTHWGFFKYRWVILKWIFTILLIPCIGVGTIGQIFSTIDKINTSGFNSGINDGRIVLVYISLQIIIMLTMITISVFKPGNKSHTSVTKDNHIGNHLTVNLTR